MATVPKGPLAPLLIGLLVAVIGAATAPLTGFAMNPARDFGPKLFTFLNGWGSVAMTGGRDSLLPRAFDRAGHRRNQARLSTATVSGAISRRQTRRGDGESSAVLIDPTCALRQRNTLRRSAPQTPFRLVSPALLPSQPHPILSCVSGQSPVALPPLTAVS